MRWIFLVALMIGFSAMVFRVFQTMSSDAIGLIIGVLLGVLASIPVALLIFAAQRSATIRDQRMQQQYREPRQQREYTGTRPMVIMMPDGRQQQQPQQPQPWHTMQPPPPRLLTSTNNDDSEAPGNFRVVGDEGSEW
jgi:hypothetical protein